MTMTRIQIILFEHLTNFYIRKHQEDLLALEKAFADAEQSEALWARNECLAGHMTVEERDSLWAGCDKRLEQFDDYLSMANRGLESLRSILKNLRKRRWEAVSGKNAA